MSKRERFMEWLKYDALVDVAVVLGWLLGWGLVVWAAVIFVSFMTTEWLQYMRANVEGFPL